MSRTASVLLLADGGIYRCLDTGLTWSRILSRAEGAESEEDLRRRLRDLGRRARNP